MNRYVTGLLLGVTMAIAVPWLVAQGSCEPDYAKLGLTLVPFGCQRVLFVHLLAALPLALLVARALSRRLQVEQIEIWTIAWLVTGAMAALLALVVSSSVGMILIDESFNLRTVARTLWCLLLELPWCCALARTTAGTGRYVPCRLDIGLALAVAILLPAVYALRVADDETKKLAEILGHGRLLKARATLEIIRELGMGEAIGDRPIAELQKQLDREIELSREMVKSPLPRSAPLAYRLEWDRRLAMLDRSAEAERDLRPLAASDLSAKRMLAWVLQERERWEESSELNREILEAQIGLAPTNAQALKICVNCFDESADNARASGNYAVAESAYREALDRLPATVAAHFHFRLGQHHTQRPRPAAALEQLQQAADLDPASYGPQAQRMIDELRRNTPACILK